MISGTNWWAGILLALSLAAALEAAESEWVQTGVTGRLIYVPDADGDRILDFSGVGYRGRGTQLIPDGVPNAIMISPIAGDDTAHIQAAIDAVSLLTPGPDGFRGAVLLAAGDYDIGTQLTIAASGVVLRGVGREVGETVLHARGTGQRPLIRVAGAGSQSLQGSTRNMIEKVVPVGATSFRIDSTSGLSVGDTVRVERPSTAEWIAAVGMDQPYDGDPAWQPGTMNIRFDRTVTRIEGNRVFLDAPLANSFELQYGGGTIRRYIWDGRIENVGIENLRAESDFAFDTDEDHAWEFVSIENAQNVWVRHTTSQYFGDSAVVSNPTAIWVTVDDAVNLDPKSVVTGERRYTFDLSGQMELVANSEANSGRHDFVNNSTRPPGPHVFYNSVSNNALNDSGPHQRWATGSLFDNVTVSGNNIDARNRESLGTRHGWSGANMVVWNSTADGYIIQNPPTAQNWLIGSTGTIVDDTEFGPQPPGYVDSHGAPVTVGGTNSLYEAQMNDTADVREFHWRGGVGNWSDDQGWDQRVKPGDYDVSVRDYLVGDIDSFAYDGAGSVDNAYVDPAWQSAIAGGSALPITKLDDLAGNQHVAFTIEHQLAGDERVVHGFLALSMQQAGGSVDADFVQLFDTAAEHRIDFADLGWDTAVNPTTPFVGVIDLGNHLDEVQSGSLNVELSDSTGLDWAMYVVTVAKPIDDLHGPAVYLDGGGSVLVDAPLAPLRSLQIGGADSGALRINASSTVAIAEGLVQHANGTLAVELGSAPGAFLTIGSAASLAGNLEVALAPGFDPMLNEAFVILTANGGITGEFDVENLPELAAGLNWQISYNETSLALLVVSALPGDYNQDGVVDAADYCLWRDHLGAPAGTLANDADGGPIGLAQFNTWKDHFGQIAGGGSGANASVPVAEPVSSLLLFFAAAFGCRRLRMIR